MAAHEQEVRKKDYAKDSHAVERVPIRETKVPYEVKNEDPAPEGKQLDLFEEKLLTQEARAEYKLIGQVFETYWLVEYHDILYIIDQHAAHERVLYEKTLRSMKTR